MTMPQVVEYLEKFAVESGVPVEIGTTVVGLERDGALYRVETDAHGMMTVSTTNTSRNAGDAFARGRQIWLGWPDEAGQRLEA